jgi:putative transcriptional regulator
MVDQGVALTASLDVLKAIADGGGPARGFLALGYAGWGPGQLDREIQENAWLSAPASLDLLFDTQHDTKWRRAMAILKVDPILLSGSAGHA